MESGRGDDAVHTLIDSDDATVLAGMCGAARTALAAGNTTVRDCGDRNLLAVRLAAETAVQPGSGPEVLAAGPPLTTYRGHCHFLGGAVEGATALRPRAE